MIYVAAKKLCLKGRKRKYEEDRSYVDDVENDVSNNGINAGPSNERLSESDSDEYNSSTFKEMWKSHLNVHETDDESDNID